MTLREDILIAIRQAYGERAGLNGMTAEQLLDAYRAEVLAEVDAQFAAMELPEELKGTFNAVSYADAWRRCRAVVQAMAEEKSSPAGADATPDKATAREARLAQLLDTIRTHGGKWSTRSVQQVRRATGGPVQRGTARRDLTELARRGHLQQHGAGDGRYYTLRRRVGGA